MDRRLLLAVALMALGAGCTKPVVGPAATREPAPSATVASHPTTSPPAASPALPPADLDASVPPSDTADLGLSIGSPPVVSRCDGVRLEVAQKKDQGGTRFVATLVNDGKQAVTLVVPGDGSDAGMRTPSLTWTATTPSGAPAPPEQVGRCGMANPIDERDIFVLAPGERRTFEEWIGAPLVKPGRYDVRLTYENNPNVRASATMGFASPAALTKLRASTPCRVTSPTLRADVGR